MRPVVPFADEANGCGTRNVELLRVNSKPELFAKHHSQEAEQGDDRGAGLFTRIRPYKIPTPKPTTKDRTRLSSHSSCISHAGRLQGSGQRDVHKGRIVCLRARSPEPWAG